MNKNDNKPDLGDIFSDFAEQGNYNNNINHKDEGPTVKKYNTYGNEVKLEQETVNIKCQGCGSSLQYDAASGMMKCEACGNMQEIPKDTSFQNNDFDPELDVKFDWQNETRIFKCSNCGAETVFDKTEFATECAFCGSPNVAETNQIEGIRPDIVVPFKMTVEKAKEYYTKWIKKRFFAPSKFKNNLDVNKFKGVYTPCWLFDSMTYSRYSGRAGQYYYVTVGSGKNRRQERRVRWFPVSGTNSGLYKNVMVEASPNITQNDIEKLKPFPLNEFVAYDKRYLLGYTADHYDSGIKDSWMIAKGIIDKNINSEIRGEILRKADVIDYVNITTNYQDKQYKYALFPIFVSHITFKEKLYKLFTNGVTGRTTGTYPKSVPKILSVIFGSLIVLAGIIVAVVLLL